MPGIFGQRVSTVTNRTPDSIISVRPSNTPAMPAPYRSRKSAEKLLRSNALVTAGLLSVSNACS